jgi:integrase/recombinase XerD
VKSLLAFGHRLGYLPFDVGRALRLPSIRNRLNERILSEADLHRILTLEPDPRNRAMLTLLYASGVRVSELCALAWRDLQPNADGGQITVFGKGNKTRSIQLPASVWQLLLALEDNNASPDHPVFRSRKGNNHGFLQPVAVLRVVRAAAKRAGLELPGTL